MNSPNTISIAVFASGGGSNARNILEFFHLHEWIKVGLICTNNPESGVWSFAPSFGVEVVLLSKEQCRDGAYLTRLMEAQQIRLIALAGYLKKIPDALVEAFPGRILNIHPSLLPAYGGKGMYGLHVHRAVIEAGETESGMSIHLVNQVYDQGEVLFQQRIAIDPGWTPEQLQREILVLEHEHYPIIIEKVCDSIPFQDISS